VWRFARRLAVLAAVLGVAWLVPAGGRFGPVRVKQAALTLIAVAGLGKILYDTFFFDRFRA
jgi:hypothetical protein